ncbi:MAG: hypothetical protein E7Z72_00340 [Methanocorpusculum parvum]|nr:hypothetical protein [Methanocorpusculum parvum]
MAEEKRHIFLTGNRRVGKTFLLQRVLSELSVPLSGFTTSWKEEENGTSALILSRADGTESAVAAYRYADDRPRQVFEEVFETFGAACLTDLQGLVLMDELGRFESSTEKFRSCVFAVLDSDLPVLGVVRDAENPFLDAVRSHPKTEVISVTKENREELVFAVRKKIKDILT